MLFFLSSSTAEEPANFLVALAKAPDFFSKRLRLLFFLFVRLRLQGAKNTRLWPAPAQIPAPQPWFELIILIWEISPRIYFF